MSIPRSERINDEDHPCQCSYEYVQHEETDVVHIKREYYEVVKWFWCLNCECHWNKVTYAVGKDSWIEITQQPYSEEEE
jgi:hypothetical protein